jgi:hypothetical protein
MSRLALALMLAGVFTLIPSSLRAEEVKVSERAGGLLPCEDLPGEAVTMRRPDTRILPRADGGVTALFFYTHAVKSKRPMQAVFVNLNTGASRVEDMAGYGNAWSHMWGPDGRLYYGLWNPATLLRYDPAKDALDTFGVIEPSQNSVPLLTIGTDEKVYAMTSPGGFVFSMDPATGEVVHYGQQGPKREYETAYTGNFAVDDEYIYSTFGNVPQETWTIAMNKKTRELTRLDEIQGAGIGQGRLGVIATHNGKEYWLYQGKAIPKKSANEKSPWPERPLVERKPIPQSNDKPEFLPNSMLTEMDGTTTLCFRLNQKEAWKSVKFRIDSEPVVLSRCATMPDGRVFASTVGYEGIYVYDPKADKMEYAGLAPISHYSTLVTADKIYLASYPGGSGLYVWDPAKPWTIGKATPEKPLPDETSPESNPRCLDPWAREGNFQFPLFFAQAGDMSLWVALHGERHNVGGALSWRTLDPKTGKTIASGFLRQPFELYDTTGLCTALDGTKIVYSSFTVKGLKGEPKPDTARLFVVDVATRKLDWFIEPLPGVDKTGMIIEGNPGELIAVTDKRVAGGAGSTLYKVNLKDRKVTQTVELPGVLANRREYFWHMDYRKGPDGMIYTFYDDMLARVNPDTLEVTTLSKVGPTGSIAFVGKDVYLSGTTHLKRVRNP